MDLPTLIVLVLVVVGFVAAIAFICKNGGFDGECNDDCASCAARCEAEQEKAQQQSEQK